MIVLLHYWAWPFFRPSFLQHCFFNFETNWLTGASCCSDWAMNGEVTIPCERRSRVLLILFRGVSTEIMSLTGIVGDLGSWILPVLPPQLMRFAALGSAWRPWKLRGPYEELRVVATSNTLLYRSFMREEERVSSVDHEHSNEKPYLGETDPWTTKGERFWFHLNDNRALPRYMD